jgi:hypothetical protein
MSEIVRELVSVIGKALTVNVTNTPAVSAVDGWIPSRLQLCRMQRFGRTASRSLAG